MGTVGGYDLHVYCDTCSSMGQYAGNTKSSAYKSARDAGWSINVHKEAPPDSAAGGESAICRQCKTSHKG